MENSPDIADPLSTSVPPPALIDWLSTHVSGFRGPATIARISGGQSNPTFRITSPSGDLVLRRRPIGMLLPSAHAVDREYRVMQALAGSGVPVPRVHGLCEDPSAAGAMFFVMDFIPGRVFWDPRLPELSMPDRRAMFSEMNRTLSAIHSLDPLAIGLGDFGRPGDYLARQVTRWTRQYRASETMQIPAMERLIDWLPAHLPEEGPTRLVHGDFRLDNVLIHPGEPKITAVLDWELSTLGDPRADIAYHMLSWHLSPDLFRGLEGADLAHLGIPDERSYLDAYIATSGIDPRPHWTFFLILSLFRLASILQGIRQRAQNGNASAADSAVIGAKAGAIAERAVIMLDGNGC